MNEAAARRRNVLLLYLLAGITTASHGSTELIYPLNLDRLGHPYAVVGLTVALLNLGSLVSRVPGGAWYGLARARLLIAVSMAAMALSSAGLSLGDWWGLQAALGAVHGFSFGLATTFQLALLIEVRRGEENVAATMAWQTAAISTGYAASGPIGALPIEWFGHGAAFLVSGLVGLLGAAASLAIRTPRQPAMTVRETPDQQAQPRSGAIRSLRALPTGVWLATLLVFYINVLSDTYNTFFPIYAVGIGISLAAVGVLKSVHSLSATFIRFAAAGIFRLASVSVVNHTAVLTMALGALALSMLTAEPALAVAFAVMGVSRGLLRVTSATAVAEERKRPGASVGMASAVYNGGLDAGSMLGPPLAGALAESFGIPTTFRLVGLALPALYYVVWFSRRSRGAASADRALLESEPRG